MITELLNHKFKCKIHIIWKMKVFILLTYLYIFYNFYNFIIEIDTIKEKNSFKFHENAA